jgi:hypothetical protein
LFIRCRANLFTGSLPMNVYSGSAIPAFRLHVTILRPGFSFLVFLVWSGGKKMTAKFWSCMEKITRLRCLVTRMQGKIRT